MPVEGWETASSRTSPCFQLVLSGRWHWNTVLLSLLCKQLGQLPLWNSFSSCLRGSVPLLFRNSKIEKAICKAHSTWVHSRPFCAVILMAHPSLLARQALRRQCWLCFMLRNRQQFWPNLTPIWQRKKEILKVFADCQHFYRYKPRGTRSAAMDSTGALFPSQGALARRLSSVGKLHICLVVWCSLTWFLCVCCCLFREVQGLGY